MGTKQQHYEQQHGTNIGSNVLLADMTVIELLLKVH